MDNSTNTWYMNDFFSSKVSLCRRNLEMREVPEDKLVIINDLIRTYEDSNLIIADAIIKTYPFTSKMQDLFDDLIRKTVISDKVYEEVNKRREIELTRVFRKGRSGYL